MRIVRACETAWYFAKAITILVCWLPIYVFMTFKDELFTDVNISIITWSKNEPIPTKDQVIESHQFDFDSDDNSGHA